MSSYQQPINLVRGWPAPSLLPADLVRSAANKILSHPSTSTPALCYGPDPGYEPLRIAVGDWLTQCFQPSAGAVTASRLAITGGASQNMGVLLNVFTDPHYTRAIWIVAPAYFLSFPVFTDAGFTDKMHAVPEDDEGADVDFLAAELEKSEQRALRDGNEAPRYKTRAEKVYKHVIYCVPAFANPSARTMSRRRREALVRLARQYDGLIICDDVYDFLQWRFGGDECDAGAEAIARPLMTAQLPRLVDFDRALDAGAEREGADGFGNVASNGSFSKIAGPGMRVGWCEGTPKMAYAVSQAGTTRSGGAPSQLTSTYITEMLVSGSLQNHIRTALLPAYASRYSRLRSAITKYLVPLGFSVSSPAKAEYGDNTESAAHAIAGGFFVWLALPPEIRGITLTQRCQREESVTIAPGENFEVPMSLKVHEDNSKFNAFESNGNFRFPHNVRLCFAWEDEDLLEEGIKRIGLVAQRMLDESSHQDKSHCGSDAEYVIVGNEIRREEAVDMETFK